MTGRHLGLRVAVLAKQVPAIEGLQLTCDGRLNRAAGHHIDPLSRRAIAQGVTLANEHAGSCRVFTMGPPVAVEVLRESLAWGADEGTLVSDTRLTGADASVTAAVLAAALRRHGPFDVVLAGRSSVDGETGTVGPQLAQRLQLPFAAGVRTLRLAGDELDVSCEQDDEIVALVLPVPAVLTVAERLCAPAKVPPERWEPASSDRIERVGVDNLELSGDTVSPTSVMAVRQLPVDRRRIILSGPLPHQARSAVALLQQWGTLNPVPSRPPAIGSQRPTEGPEIAVLVEPGRPHDVRALLGQAALIASSLSGHVTALVAGRPDLDAYAGWGADRVRRFAGSEVAEEVARGCVAAYLDAAPHALLGASTAFAQETLSRLAAQWGAGITCDATGVRVVGDALVAEKPGVGGSVVADIGNSCPPYLLTLRAGALRLCTPRARDRALTTILYHHGSRSDVRVRHRETCDSWEALERAECVVGVGYGVGRDEYPKLAPLLEVLDAELAATRKVADAGWQPRSRQLGITGRYIRPSLYLAIGLAGKHTHTAGVRAAGVVFAINRDPEAPVFGACDIGIVADWRDLMPLLVAELGQLRPAGAQSATSTRGDARS